MRTHLHAELYVLTVRFCTDVPRTPNPDKPEPKRISTIFPFGDIIPLISLPSPPKMFTMFYQQSEVVETKLQRGIAAIAPHAELAPFVFRQLFQQKLQCLSLRLFEQW